MVVEVDKEEKKIRIFDRAMKLYAYWETHTIKKFKSRTGWILQVDLCQQVENEMDCNILMLRDIEAYFCKQVNRRAVDDPIHLSWDFKVAKYQRLLKGLFEAVQADCDNYLDVILRNGPLFMQVTQ